MSDTANVKYEARVTGDAHSMGDRNWNCSESLGLVADQPLLSIPLFCNFWQEKERVLWGNGSGQLAREKTPIPATLPFSLTPAGWPLGGRSHQLAGFV